MNIETAVLSCWGKPRHLTDPRPDLVEFQEQTKAIHTFLSKPEAVTALGKIRHQDIKTRQSADSIERGRGNHLTKFSNGHVQLEWERGGWIVRNWHTVGTRHATWIHLEENLLSELIRPPSRPEKEGNDPTLGTVTGLRGQTPGKCATQEWPHPNTATMIVYMFKMEWKSPTFVGYDW